MRNAFADAITRLAETDPRVVLLSGDIGNRLFDAFKQRFPDRFFNCGVAEANMTGMAAGIGFRAWTEEEATEVRKRFQDYMADCARRRRRQSIN